MAQILSKFLKPISFLLCLISIHLYLVIFYFPTFKYLAEGKAKFYHLVKKYIF